MNNLYLDLRKIGLIKANEQILLSDCEKKAEVVWVWLMKIHKKLIFTDNKIPGQLCKNIHDELFGGREAIQKTFMYLETQFPLPYVTLIGMERRIPRLF